MENRKETIEIICDTVKKNVEQICKKREEETVIDILWGLLFMDCMKECNYSKMTGEEVVKEVTNTIDKIINKYNIKYSFTGNDNL